MVNCVDKNSNDKLFDPEARKLHFSVVINLRDIKELILYIE